MVPKQLLIGFAIAIGSTSGFSQDSLTVDVKRIITHFRCELVTQQGKWPLPIGRIRQEAFIRYGQFNGLVSVSRGLGSREESLRTLLMVNPIRVNWQPNGYSGLPIGEKSYSRIHRSEAGTWVLVVHAILDDVLITTSCTTFRGASPSWTADSFKNELEGAARAILALDRGERLLVQPAGSYLGLSNIPRLTDGERTFIPLDKWLAARGITGSMDDIKGVLRFSRAGQTYSWPAGTPFLKKGDSTLQMSKVMVRRDGKWWVPHSVIDSLVP